MMEVSVEERAVNANQPKDKLAVGVSVVGVGLALYWMFTYSGPYRYLAEWQQKWFGWYVPKLTVLVIVMGFVGIAAVVKVMFRGAEQPAPTLPQGSASTVSGIGIALRPNSGAGNGWLVSPYARLWFLVIPLVMGGYFYFNAAQAGELQQLSVQDFDGGQVKSRILYAEVRGRLSRKYMMKDTYMYIPMLEPVVSGTPASSRPAHVLVGVDKAQTKKYLQVQADNTFVVRGMVEKGPEGDVRAAFEKNGISLAETCWVVHTGRDPKGDRKLGLILMAISGLLAAGLGSWLSQRSKKNAAAQPMQAGI
jgi:hypothetical protein